MYGSRNSVRRLRLPQFHATKARFPSICFWVLAHHGSLPTLRGIVSTGEKNLGGGWVNTSRGSTIDDDALIDALENKKIYAAGLDVFNNEPNLDNRYLKLDNCFVLPHVGSATHETRLAMSMMAVDNIYCFFNKKPLISEVV